MPTRDTRQLLQLVRLRLESLSFSSGVMEIVLHAVGVSVFEQQLELPGAEPGPNLEDANRAFAAIRADLGNDAVVYAPLNDGHLPEAQYGWEVMKQVALPKPNAVTKAPLIRRVYAPPIQLPPRERHEPDGWLIAGVSEGPVEEVIGPQIVSGGWWIREVSRTYYYVRTRSNRWLWIYFDYKRRRWFLHGEVQ